MHRSCDVEGCESKHLASGMCKSHYRRKRWAEGKDGSVAVRLTLGAIVWRHSAFAPESRSLVMTVPFGPIAYCPYCPCVMQCAPNNMRWCGGCGTSLQLNAEEVSWAVSEARSIRQSRQLT
jgi:hypothetical protein